MKPTINIGEKIKEELKRQERNASWLAKEMNCSRTHIYKILNRCYTDQLVKISKLLKQDFFKYYSEELQNMKIWND